MRFLKTFPHYLYFKILVIFIFGFTTSVLVISPPLRLMGGTDDYLIAVANASSPPQQGWKSTPVKAPPKQGWKSTPVKAPPKQGWKSTPVKAPPKQGWKSTPVKAPPKQGWKSTPTAKVKKQPELAKKTPTAANTGQDNRASTSKKVQESDQKIQALQKRIQESKKREKDLNAEYQKTNQGIIGGSAMGAVGEEAGSRGSRTQRTNERGKAALEGPGVAMTQARDTWHKNLDAERQTRQDLERELKAAQTEKESYQRKLKDLR